MRDKLATKSKIVMCFFQLLQKKRYDRITVKDICKAADTSRMTFYRNFHTKEDLVIYHFDIMYTSFLQQLLTNPTHRFYDIANILFQLIKNDQRAMEVIVDNDLIEIMRNRIKYYTKQLIDEEVIPNRHESSDLLVAMISGGLTEILVTWTKSGMKEPVASMIIFVSKYVHLKN